ncbi:MAG TPA: FAD-binding oxidoreductase [Candidatus Sulfomarinibacteraceae bacterium]|nr:FAD-binding oxidoreductase [Candidatus Sulfomarinibacteraceae bacterium]
MTVKTLHGELTDMEPTIDDLRPAFRGELVRRGDPGYADCRRIYNAMIDREPAVIAVCSDVADVVAAIRLARKHDLLTSVRGGGHNGAGLALCDGGLTVDLSQLRGIRVDPADDTVRVEAGCVWADVDHATHAFGRAVPSGIIGTTGVAGLTLGGGHGYLTRKYGLTVDNLLEADVVLADGSVVTASDSSHEDLFWAIRGGGGNFGVVTSFLFRTRPVSNVHAGPMLWSLDDAGEVLRWYRSFSPAAPDDLYAFFAFMVVPPAAPFPEELHGRKACSLMWCATDTDHGSERIDAATADLPAPLWAHVGGLPFPALQSAFDRFYPPGLEWYWKGDFVREIDDEAVALHLEHGSALPTPHSTVHLYPIDGAVHDVPAGATAFAHRDANWSMVITGVDPDPANRDAITGWARDYWQALHPHSAGGAYVNFMMEEGTDRIRATYRDNYDRLCAVKRRYDPDNLFRVNQNIAPAEAT